MKMAVPEKSRSSSHKSKKVTNAALREKNE